MKLLQKAKLFLAEERGANAIEYGLIASLISVVIIAAVEAIGLDLLATFNTIAAAL
jgi:pilus assembly protein Flp/PilA